MTRDTGLGNGSYGNNDDETYGAGALGANAAGAGSGGSGGAGVYGAVNSGAGVSADGAGVSADGAGASTDGADWFNDAEWARPTQHHHHHHHDEAHAADDGTADGDGSHHSEHSGERRTRSARSGSEHSHSEHSHSGHSHSSHSSAGHSGDGHRRRRKKKKVWPWVLGIVIVVIVALAAVAGICGSKLYSEAKEVQSHEEKALSLMGSLSSAQNLESFSDLSGKIGEIQNETKAANDIAHGSLWNIAAKMPWIGDDFTTVQGMTEVVEDLSSKAVPQFMDVVSSLENATLTDADGSLNLQPILDSQKNMASANEDLQREVSKYENLPEPKISMVSSAYETGKTKLTGLADTVNQLSNTFAMLPSFLGADGEQTYAIMAVTQSELRSSGGLTGSVGEMTTDDGHISVGDFRSTNEYLEYGHVRGEMTTDEANVFTETGPMKMSFDIRDLSALPDTSHVAAALRSIWNITSWGQGTTLDGLIIADPVFLQELVGINGNVTLSNGTVLTGENTAQYLLNTVYMEYGNDSEATDAVFQEVAEESISKMFANLNVSKLIKVGSALSEMAQERHFSMYSFNADTEKTIAAAGFTATSPSSEEDPEVGIYFNEQQGSKMGWYLERNATVQETYCRDDGAKMYQVEYTMKNTMTEEEAATLPTYITGTTKGQEGWLLEKTLIYAPAGGSISGLSITGTGTSTTPQEVSMDGATPYMSVITLKPGQSVTISFSVLTSAKATQTLGIDQTPLNYPGTNVTVEKGGCSTSSK